MEYLIGALASSVLTTMIFYFVARARQEYPIVKIKASQSRTHRLYPPILNIRNKEINTQAIVHRNQNLTRIIFTEKNAYWIKDNRLYEADTDNGLIVENSEKPVDTMGMDKVKLDEMMFIVEKLTEGKNIDNWGSWN